MILFWVSLEAITRRLTLELYTKPWKTIWGHSAQQFPLEGPDFLGAVLVQAMASQQCARTV